MNNQLFNAKVSSKSRDYFFDVKQSQRGDYYLVINQSKKQENGYERQSLMVFNNLLPDFAAAFAQSMQKLSELDPAIIWDPRAVLISGKTEQSDREAQTTFRSKTETRNPYRVLTDSEIAHEQQMNERNGKPRNAGLRWSTIDRDKVKQYFLRGEAIPAIADTLERSVHSISAELKKQGLIVDTPNTGNDKPF